MLVSSGARVSYAVDQPAALVSFAVHLSGSTGATIRAWQETSAGATAIASTQVTGAGWHDLFAPLVPADRSSLTFEAQTEPSPGSVTWSAPVVLAEDHEPDRPQHHPLRRGCAACRRIRVCMAPERVAPPRSTRSAVRGWSSRAPMPPHRGPSPPSLPSSPRCIRKRTGSVRDFIPTQLPQSVFTLQAALAAGGYLTAQFSANPFTGTLSNLDQGFDIAVTPQGLRGAGTPSDAAPAIRARQIHQRAMAWITRHQGRPVLCLHPRPRHSPTVQRNRPDRAGSL